MLGARAAGVLAQAVMHVPVEVARAARARRRRSTPIAASRSGGGSTIGLGKAIALESSLPIIAVPTTYAGSEMTPIYGLTEGRLKSTGRDPRVLPRTVIYDPSLTLSLPAGHFGVIGHERDGARGRSAVCRRRQPRHQPDGGGVDPRARRSAAGHRAQARRRRRCAAARCTARGSRARVWARSAWRCTTSSVTRWAARSTCRTRKLTRRCCRIPRTTTTPPRPTRSRAWRVRSAARHAAEAGPLLFELNRALGISAALAQLGMPESGLDEAAELACQNPYANPRAVERDAIRALLQRAWQGVAPA